MKNRKLLLSRLHRLRRRQAGIRPSGANRLYRYQYRLPTLAGSASEVLSTAPEAPLGQKK